MFTKNRLIHQRGEKVTENASELARRLVPIVVGCGWMIVSCLSGLGVQQQCEETDSEMFLLCRQRSPKGISNFRSFIKHQDVPQREQFNILGSVPTNNLYTVTYNQ